MLLTVAELRLQPGLAEERRRRDGRADRRPAPRCDQRIETTLAARERRSEAVLLRRIGCPTHRAEIDSRGRKCNAEAPNDEPGTYFRAGGGAAAQRIREAASRPLLRVRGHGQGAVRS